jgi:hypothetical protein
MITITDPNSTLTVAQVHELQARAAAYRFDVKLLIDGEATSKMALESTVASMVNGPHTLVIGIAPTHHFTFVKASVDLGLPTGPAVAAAGNQFFRAGDLVNGIDAIAAKAQSLRTASAVIQSQTGVPIVVQQHTTSAGVWWLLGGLALLTVAVAAWIMWRNKRRDEEMAAARVALDLEAAELRSRNLEEREWYDRMAARVQDAPSAVIPLPSAPRVSYAPTLARSVQPVVVSQPTPVVVQNQSNGLDNLLAFELGEMSGRDRGRDRVVEREVVVERDSGSSSSSSWGSDSSSSSTSSSSWSDSSSSSSSWSDSSSSDSSSSSDWGSSSSGGDWGGGSDSGSSGSDW